MHLEHVRTALSRAALLAAALLSGAAGVLVGLPALRLKGIYLAIATMAFGFIVEEIITRWEHVTGGFDGLPQVLEGIEAALLAGLAPVKLNCVVQRGINEAGVLDLVKRFRGTGVTVRHAPQPPHRFDDALRQRRGLVLRQRLGDVLVGDRAEKLVFIAGLALIVWLFAQQWRASYALPDALHGLLARGLVVTMAVGCLFNTFMIDHTEKMFFAWLSGVLFSPSVPHGERTA